MTLTSSFHITIDACDGLAGIHKSVEPEWCVTQKLQLGCCNGNHDMVACAPIAFSISDLIDVTVTCDIVIR